MSRVKLPERTVPEAIVSDFGLLPGGPSTTTRLRRLSVRAGPIKFAALVGLVAFVGSIAATAAVQGIFTPGSPFFWIGMSISAVVPLIVAPPIGWFIAQLMLEVDQARRTAERLAVTDALTGVFNRRRFFTIGEIEFDRAQRLAQPLTVMLIDIDLFKAVNDVHGHAMGDLVLRNVAQACALELRQYDVLARYGGEEFVALLPATAMPTALTVAERLRGSVAALRCASPGHDEIRPTISIGVAGFADAPSPSFAGLLERADQAMYGAKQSGRNRVCSAPPALA